MASFAKFREMQKTVLRKIFRENWVRNTAKMITADFDPFWVKIDAKRGLLLGIFATLFDVINSDLIEMNQWQLKCKLFGVYLEAFPWNQLFTFFVKNSLSRNFCHKNVRENYLNFYKCTVCQVISRKNCNKQFAICNCFHEIFFKWETKYFCNFSYKEFEFPQSFTIT